jgi:hypothetical protein
VAGRGEFNRKKFEELIVYIAKRLGPEAASGRVKLTKLLMLSDFAAYQRLGTSGHRRDVREVGTRPPRSRRVLGFFFGLTSRAACIASSNGRSILSCSPRRFGGGLPLFSRLGVTPLVGALQSLALDHRERQLRPVSVGVSHR